MAIEDEQTEAVYFSMLASLDDLPSHEARFRVALNWVKYVMLGEAATQAGISPETHSEMMSRLSTLCLEFAEQVMLLPMLYADHMSSLGLLNFCCECAECAAYAASDLAERPTEPAPRDETVN